MSSSKVGLFWVGLTKSDESLKGNCDFFLKKEGKDLKHEKDSLAGFQKETYCKKAI